MKRLLTFVLLLAAAIPGSVSAAPGWQNRLVVSTAANFSSSEYPQIGLDSTGNGFMTFQSDSNQSVAAYRPAGASTWDKTVELTVPGNSLFYPRLSVSPAGRALVGFIEDGGPRIVRSALCDTGQWTVGALGNGAWTLSTTPSDIGVAINDIGEAAIVWVEGTQLMFVRRTSAGVWDAAPQTATLNGLSSFQFPKLHMDNAGNMILVWQQSTSLVYSFFTPATLWNTPQVLATTPERFSLPVSAGDAIGRLVIVAARHSPLPTGMQGGRSWRISTADGTFAVLTDDSVSTNFGAEAAAGFIPGTSNAAVGFSNDGGTPRLNVIDAQSLEEASSSDATVSAIPGVAATLLAGGEALVLGTYTDSNPRSVRAYTKAASGAAGALTEETFLDTGTAAVSAPSVSADKQGRAAAMYIFADGSVVTWDYVGNTSVQENRVAVPALVPNAPQIAVVNLDATILMEKLRARRRAQAFTLRAGRRNTARVSYQSVTERFSDLEGNPVTGEVIRRLTKRNTFTLKNLATGSYRTKYRGVITVSRPGKPDKVRRTKFSPSSGFTIGSVA